MDDLTNYVYAITNYWTAYDSSLFLVHTGVNGYTLTNSTASVDGGPFAPTPTPFPLTNGLCIIGLLSTPEYACQSGQPIPTILYGGVSNHIVAYVRSLSGPAVEKPPQNNQIIQADAFGYRILCINAPEAASPVVLNGWDKTKGYGAGVKVFSDCSFWYSLQTTFPGEAPGVSPKWLQQNNYNWGPQSMLHELRLTFLWPQLANGGVGPGRQTFRTMVTGQMSQISTNGQWLYFYKPQNFANAQ
jgi:hypothetical protein